MFYLTKVIALLLLLFVVSCSKESATINHVSEVSEHSIANHLITASAETRDQVAKDCFSCLIEHHVQTPQFSKGCRKYTSQVTGHMTTGWLLTVTILDNTLQIEDFLSLTAPFSDIVLPLVPNSVEIQGNQIILGIDDFVETIIETGYFLRLSMCPITAPEPTGICDYQSFGNAVFIGQTIEIFGAANFLPICSEQLCVLINSSEGFIEINSSTLDLCFTPTAMMAHDGVCEIAPIGAGFINEIGGMKRIRFFFEQSFWECYDESYNPSFDFYIEHANPLL